MKRIGVFVATVLLVGLTAVAQASPQGGWLPLFNGKDLNGWKQNGDESGLPNRVRSFAKAPPINTDI